MKVIYTSDAAGGGRLDLLFTVAQSSEGNLVGGKVPRPCLDYEQYIPHAVWRNIIFNIVKLCTMVG